VVQCDSNFSFSPSKQITPGVSTVLGDGSTPVVRWGDYTTLARRYSTNSCFFAGAYAQSNAYQSRIAEIGLLSTKKNGIGEHQSSITSSDVSVFPNPVNDYFTVNFEVEQPSHLNIALFDIQGRQVELLFDGQTISGNQKFSFNKASLPAGVYSLIIRGESGNLVTRKIVVE
jgi:hypothetical protein